MADGPKESAVTLMTEHAKVDAYIDRNEPIDVSSLCSKPHNNNKLSDS